MKNREIFCWNGLPALTDGDYTAVFSIINNQYVVTRDLTSKFNNETVNYLKDKNFFEWNSGKEPILKEKVVVLSLSEKCNCRCKYCFLDAESCGKTMSVELLHASIDYAFKDLNGRKLKIAAFGGEPTLQPTLLKEMVRYAKEVQKEKYPDTQISFAITTNGIMNKDTLDFLINEHFKVTLSMDGTEEIQNMQRPLPNNKPSFPYVKEALTRFVESNTDVNVRITVTEYSVDKMLDIVNYLHSVGIKKIHFEAVSEAGRALKNKTELCKNSPDVKSFSNKLIECIELATKYKMEVNCSPFVWCNGSIDNRIVVSPYGMLSSCVEIQDPSSEMAEYFKYGTIDEQGNVNIEQRIMKHTPKNPDDKRECNKCPYYLFCKRSCPTRNYRTTKSTCNTDYFKCDFIKIVMPYILNKIYDSVYKKEV